MNVRFLLVLLTLFVSSAAVCDDATSRVKAAVDYWRGATSYAEASMTIHRPDWERTMSLRTWMKGRKLSLVRFTAPPKDAGMASLTVGDDLWNYSPKINSVMQIPPSMRAQSWAGSDFSYSDLAKADDIINFYTHTIVGQETNEGKKVDVIECVPTESAPVVWGKEVIKVRSDDIILERDFFDQKMKLIKRMIGHDLQMMDGKLYMKVLRMENLEKKDEWTEVVHDKVRFGIDIPDSKFTQQNLRNPQE